MNITSSRNILCAAALCLISATAFSQAVANGNFLGADESLVGADRIDSWAATGSISIRNVRSLNHQMGLDSVSIGAPPGGTLDSNVVQAWSVTGKPSTLSQTIDHLVVGHTYAISFDEAVANRGAASYAGSFSWGVRFGDQTANSHSIAIPGAWGTSQWVHSTLLFTATAASQVLEFLSQSTVGVAPEPILLLSRASISPAAVSTVPEPSSCALLFAGLAAIGWTVRRPRRSI